MGTIQTGTGLASGINITEIVDALIDAQRGTIVRLQSRVQSLKQTQTGLTTLSAAILTMSTSGTQLGAKATFNKRTVTSTDPDQLLVTTVGSAQIGTYQFQAVRKATSQQSVSRGFADTTTQTIGTAGTLTLSKGGKLQVDRRLDLLNAGGGVGRGSIRITDRSGASAVVDLSGAVTVDDVLNTINSQTSLRVTARAEGDRFVLEDNTGATTVNLTVAEVGIGTTAADLGLAGSVAADSLTGSDVYEVTGDFKLTQINDGNAVRLVVNQDDIRITLTDDPTTTLDIDLDGAVTLNDVVSKINDAEDNTGLVSASISQGRIVLTDLTAGGGAAAFSVSDLNGATVTRQLGLDATATGATLTGRALGGGINSVLLRNLKGGTGVEELGEITLTDRTGTTATIDLSAAETLDDAIRLINAAESDTFVKLQLTATINATGNGLKIVDTSGATASNLIIADETGSTFAADLGIAVDAAQTSIDTGALHLQRINEATTLANYGKNGRVALGSFVITDSQGNESLVSLSSTVKTVGDVLQRINAATGADVTARLNETGDGIELIDNAGGAAQLNVRELGANTARDLRILGTGTTGTDGKSHLSGRTSAVITIAATDTLTTLSAKINTAGIGISAATLDDGSSINPARLGLQAQASGTAGEFLIDDGGLGLGFSSLVTAHDAILRVGSSASSGYLLTSSSNKFDKAVSGLSIDLLQVGSSAAEVRVTQDSSGVQTALSGFITSYNTVLSAVTELTKYDITTNTKGVLQGNGTALRVVSRFQSIVNRSFAGTDGTLRTLVNFGVTAGLGGKLSLDTTRLAAALADDPAAVEAFFLTKPNGFADQISQAVTQYTDKIDGNLTVLGNSAQSTIDTLNSRVEELEGILVDRRTRLLNQFVKAEQAISSLQSQQSAISQIARLSTPSED